MTRAEIEFETLLRITQIDREVERLLGMSEEETPELQLYCNALLREIDTIYLKTVRKEVEEIYRKIDEIHRKNYPKEIKETLLKKEERALHKLYLLVEEINLSFEEEERIETLCHELEMVNKIEKLSDLTITRVESLLDEKERLAHSLISID